MGAVMLASVASASADDTKMILAGVQAQNGRAAIPNTDFVNSALYLVRFECHPYELSSTNPNNFFTSIIENRTRQIQFTLTLSNAPIGPNEIPPPSSVLAAMPIVVDTLSNVAPVTTRNGSCNQSFLVTGRTSLYLTALFTDQINTAPSPLVKFVEALAGEIVPLAVFFPKGPANLLKQDTTVANSMAQPYSDLIGALNWQSSKTDTEPVQQGYYVVKTSVGYVSVSVDKLASLQSALKISQISQALDNAWQTLGLQTLPGQLATNPAACSAVGNTLETNQNLIHSDAVDALAHIILYNPSITSSQATACLGKYFGPEVAENAYFKANNRRNLHLGPVYPDIPNLVPYQPLVFSEISSAMTNYAAGKDTKSVLDTWFEPQISVTDTGPSIFNGPTSVSIEQVLDKLKTAPPQFVSYGCSETDNSSNDAGILDSGYMLAIGKDGKPDDLLVLRTWWRYKDQSTQTRIYQMFIGADAAIQKALSDYKNVCGYHIKVNVPAAAEAPGTQGSQTALATPPDQATKPVPAH